MNEASRRNSVLVAAAALLLACIAIHVDDGNRRTATPRRQHANPAKHMLPTVVSADFTVKKLMLAGLTPSIGPSRHQLHDFIERALVPLLEDDTKGFDAVRVKAEEFIGAGPWEGGWMEFDVLQDGERIRNVMRSASPQSTSAFEERRIRDAHGEVWYTPTMQQADVYPSHKGIQIERLQDIVLTPSPDWPLPSNRVNGQNAAIFHNGSTIEADIQTGFVHCRIRKSPTGKIFSEHLQYLAQEMPCGTWLPRLVAQVDYHNHSGDDPPVYLCQLYVFDRIRLNLEVDDEEFRISTPPNTTVVKWDGRSVRSERTSRAVDDVRVFASDPAFTERNPSRSLDDLRVDGRAGPNQ